MSSVLLTLNKAHPMLNSIRNFCRVLPFSIDQVRYIHIFTKFTRANSFSNRIINDWNSLPDYIVNADSLTTFKNLLDKFWTNLHYFYID